MSFTYSSVTYLEQRLEVAIMDASNLLCCIQGDCANNCPWRSLPLVDSEYHTPERKAVEPLVLVVDDEINIRKALERLLRRNQYRVETVGSVAEARNFLSSHGTHLVITDLRMPDEDGIDMLKYVAEHHPQTARILLTGHADLEQTMRAINEGNSGQILTKPWQDEHLLKVVHEQSERARLQIRNDQLMRLNRVQNEQLRELNKFLERRVEQRTEELKKSADSLARSNKGLVQSYRSTIRLLLEISAMNPVIDADLAKEMAEVGVTLANACELSKADVQAVRYACQLHELGKLSLPQSVATSRESLLTTAGWGEYKQYPERGSLALTSVDYLSRVAEFIAHHREHFDGSGFPRGLAGTEIPIGSQIVLLVRDFVLAVHRIKERRTALGRRGGGIHAQIEALTEMEAHVDQRYDSALVEALKHALAVEEVEVEEEAPRGHLVSARTLEPGMILAQDVYTEQDMLMLTKGQKLTDRHIEKLLTMETDYGRDLSIFIES